MTKSLNDLKIKIYADSADLEVIDSMSKNPLIKGFTTNPTLMRKAGVNDYKAFASELLQMVPHMPVSFEVLSDDFLEMERQALEIASWGKNVYVKIPITNAIGQPSSSLIKRLADAEVQINVTALLTPAQINETTECLSCDTNSMVSVFAGRIADTGRDPVPIMAQAVKILKARPKSELIWASPRELLNIFQADSIGCHIITATSEVLTKLSLVGKSLEQYSLETVRMFRRDAVHAGFHIGIFPLAMDKK